MAPETAFGDPGHFEPNPRRSHDIDNPEPEVTPRDDHDEGPVDFSKGANDAGLDMFFPDADENDVGMAERPVADDMTSSFLAAGTDLYAAQPSSTGSTRATPR